MLKKLLPLALPPMFIATVNADEADMKRVMESKLGAKVESVTKSGYLGLYEVYSEGSILYTDEKMTAFIAGGQLIDGKTMKNVTEERMRKLTAIKFSELPLDRAIKQVRGDGKRVMATFEDPNCGYCTVSYTHLDVYKRQDLGRGRGLYYLSGWPMENAASLGRCCQILWSPSTPAQEMCYFWGAVAHAASFPQPRQFTGGA